MGGAEDSDVWCAEQKYLDKILNTRVSSREIKEADNGEFDKHGPAKMKKARPRKARCDVEQLQVGLTQEIADRNSGELH